jgi:hypothetical protein
VFYGTLGLSRKCVLLVSHKEWRAADPPGDLLSLLTEGMRLREGYGNREAP